MFVCDNPSKHLPSLTQKYSPSTTLTVDQDIFFLILFLEQNWFWSET